MTATDEPFVVALPPETPRPRANNWWTPQSLDQAMALAKMLAESTMVPKDYQGKPANVLLAMQFGAEIGLGPLAALQSVAVINGRPSLWGDAMLAVCMGHREWEWFRETTESGKPAADGKVSADDVKAVCTIKRRGMSERTVAFSIKDAKRAGLWEKSGPWTLYPQRMMQLRARAFCLRDMFPDALRGISSAEEMIDMKQADAIVTGTEPLSGVAALKARLGVDQPKLPIEPTGKRAETPQASDDNPLIDSKPAARTAAATPLHEQILEAAHKSMIKIEDVYRQIGHLGGKVPTDTREFAATDPAILTALLAEIKALGMSEHGEA